MPVRPLTLNPTPGIALALHGGLVATLLLSALLFVAPVLGLPFLDFPRLVGGLFTSSPTTAFWIGFWLFFLVGVFILAPLFAIVWKTLPGRGVGNAGALVKGVLFGAALWVLSGLLMPLLFTLNRLDEPTLADPGFFAIEIGWLAAAGVLGGHLVFGAALALVAAMGRGISPLDTMGWPGYHKALSPPDPGLIGEEEFPDSPSVGLR